jgi:hypothetical protein
VQFNGLVFQESFSAEKRVELVGARQGSFFFRYGWLGIWVSIEVIGVVWKKVRTP